MGSVRFIELAVGILVGATGNLKVASNLWPVGSRDLFAASLEQWRRINQNAIFDSTSLGGLYSPPKKKTIYQIARMLHFI